MGGKRTKKDRTIQKWDSDAKMWRIVEDIPVDTLAAAAKHIKALGEPGQYRSRTTEAEWACSVDTRVVLMRTDNDANDVGKSDMSENPTESTRSHLETESDTEHASEGTNDF